MSPLFATFATLLVHGRVLGFDRARASSTSGAGNLVGSPANAAVNAISAGSATWSSAGGHGSGETVTFEGTLGAAATIDGVQISWLHAPAEIRILTSDGSAVEEAVGWRRTGKDDDSFAESIQFPRSMKAKNVRLAMRARAGGPIAIAQFAATTSTADPVMLISGITASSEQCVIVENGSDLDGAAVTIDGCSQALAAGDGREILAFTPAGQLQSVGGKCVIIGGGITDFGGSVELGPCDDSDGRSQFALSDGHVVTSHGMCLSLSGPRPSSTNAAKEAQASASSSSDGTAPNNVADGSSSTSWESGTTEGPASISFEFPEERRVREVAIEWTKVARSFTVQIQNSGPWVDFASTTGNVLTETTSHGATGLAKRLRIVMKDQNSAFGIRNVNVATAPSRLIVQDCDEAALAGDSRSTFFAQNVPEFSPRESASLRAVAPLYAASLQELSHSAASLVDNLPALEKCGKRSSFLLHAKSSDATMLFEAHTQGGTSDNEASVLDEAYNCSPGEFSKVLSSARAVLSTFEK